MFIQTNIQREILGKGDSLLLQGDAAAPCSLLEPYYGQVQCVYIDPPFFTGKKFSRKRPFGESGWAKGSPCLILPSYEDRYDSMDAFLEFLRGLLEQAKALLAPSGVLYLHLDWRAVAHARLLCDEIFGEKNFLNEIIWSYESGGMTKRHFPRKHDTILMFARSRSYHFDLSQVPIDKRRSRKNHMRRDVDENGRAYRSIRSGGKIYRYYDDDPVYPTDVWTDISHLQQKDPERSGFLTQKPLKLLHRLLAPVVRPGDLVADLCCGSGTTLAAAQALGCRVLGMDIDPGAINLAAARLPEGYTLAVPSAESPAALEASLQNDVFTLSAFTPEGSDFPVSADPLAALEQWRIGEIRDDTLVIANTFARTSENPRLFSWLEAPKCEGPIGLSITDAACVRRVYRWVDD